jgi:hypothetical protein
MSQSCRHRADIIITMVLMSSSLCGCRIPH